jgi:DNA polymerase III, delta subunit
MIGTTHIIVTKTQLDATLLGAISVGYLENIAKAMRPSTIWELYVVEGQKAVESELAEYNKGIDANRILIPILKTKDEYKRFFAEIYSQYTQPTYCLLGDISTIDETAQEGMLKILEEPPTNLSLVLFAQDLSIVKPTILSRATVHVLPDKLIPLLLDTQLLETSKKYLPEYKSTLAELVQKKTTLIRDIDWKKVERPVLDFWLWQIGYYAEMLLAQGKINSDSLLTISTSISQARKYNQQNLQKKLVVESLVLRIY